MKANNKNNPLCVVSLDTVEKQTKAQFARIYNKGITSVKRVKSVCERVREHFDFKERKARMPLIGKSALARAASELASAWSSNF